MGAVRSEGRARAWSVRAAVLLLVLLGPLVVASTPARAGFAGTFADDDGSVHEPDIEAVAAAGITTGCTATGDRYCPRDPVTRAQMATFLARALDLDGSAPDAFTDDDGSPHEASIDLVAAAGITLGCDEGLFCPRDPVTRDQMASFLVRALPGLEPPTGDRFVDDDGSVHEAAIDTLAQNGVTTGCDATGTRYCPLRPVTRAQMATFLTRALGLEPIEPTPAPPDPDPEHWTTPQVVGTGVRVVEVPTSGSPTLQQAFDDARPGDRIVLAPGRHTLGDDGDVVLRRSGTPTAWIEVRGADGPRPTLDLEGRGELRISGSHVLLAHVEVVGGAGNNLHVTPGSSDVTDVVVRDVRISDLRSGPGSAIKVNRNNPEGAGVRRVYIESCDVSESVGNAVIDGVGVDTAVVRDCWIHDSAPGSHGVFFKGGSNDVLLERNLVSGIRGNAAVQLGGDTGAPFWNPAHPDQEGVRQVARNNLLTDLDDSAFEIRGVRDARVLHNTVVSDTDFTIFRLTLGNDASGGESDNADVEIANNLVVSTGGTPQYARNDGATTAIAFRNQLWAGELRNASSGRTGVPTFPAAGDVVVPASALASVLARTDEGGLAGVAAGRTRFAPAPGSPALGAGVPLDGVPRDARDVLRSTTAPTIGAVERP